MTRIVSQSSELRRAVRTMCLESPPLMQFCLQLYNMFYGPNTDLGPVIIIIIKTLVLISRKQCFNFRKLFPCTSINCQGVRLWKSWTMLLIWCWETLENIIIKRWIKKFTEPEHHPFMICKSWKCRFMWSLVLRIGLQLKRYLLTFNYFSYSWTLISFIMRKNCL